MKPLIVILGLRGSGRLAVARELAENGWSEGKVIRTFRESREAETGAVDTWTFAAQATTLPSPGEADAGILITHGVPPPSTRWRPCTGSCPPRAGKCSAS